MRYYREIPSCLHYAIVSRMFFLISCQFFKFNSRFSWHWYKMFCWIHVCCAQDFHAKTNKHCEQKRACQIRVCKQCCLLWDEGSREKGFNTSMLGAEIFDKRWHARGTWMKLNFNGNFFSRNLCFLGKLETAFKHFVKVPQAMSKGFKRGDSLDVIENLIPRKNFPKSFNESFIYNVLHRFVEFRN